MFTFFQKSIHALSSIKKLSHFWERREVPIGFEPMKNGFADRPLRPLGHSTKSLD